MERIKRLLGRQVVSETSEGRLAQITSYVAGVAILVLGVLKLGRLESLTEKELFFGLLLVLCFSTLCIVLGHLSWLVQLVKESNSERSLPTE
jgi:uncharacterized membrane protein